jgi:putative transposase
MTPAAASGDIPELTVILNAGASHGSVTETRARSGWSLEPSGDEGAPDALPKSAHKDAKAALAEIYNAEDRDHAEQAAKAFAAAYGAKWPKAVAKITNDLDVLLAFYDFPGEHWIHLRTTNPIESTFATVRLRQRVTKGPGSRAAGIAMAFKLIESAQHRWRAVNSAHLVALVRAGAKFENGVLVERPDESASGDTHAA